MNIEKILNEVEKERRKVLVTKLYENGFNSQDKEVKLVLAESFGILAKINEDKFIELFEKEIEDNDDELRKKIANSIVNLADFNLSKYIEEDPHSLSVGQKRRVTIGSVLSMLPKIIIIDEPDTGLDYKNAKRLMDHIKKLNELGHTIILISHNLELIADYCNRIIYLENGEIKDISNFFK